ncbi:unnamed protein product, partial [marine sediment metagenome]
MRRRMTHLFVGLETGIGTGSSTLDARRKETQQRWVPIETRR